MSKYIYSIEDINEVCETMQWHGFKCSYTFDPVDGELFYFINNFVVKHHGTLEKGSDGVERRLWEVSVPEYRSIMNHQHGLERKIKWTPL